MDIAQAISLAMLLAIVLGTLQGIANRQEVGLSALLKKALIYPRFYLGLVFLIGAFFIASGLYALFLEALIHEPKPGA